MKWEGSIPESLIYEIVFAFSFEYLRKFLQLWLFLLQLKTFPNNGDLTLTSVIEFINSLINDIKISHIIETIFKKILV